MNGGNNVNIYLNITLALLKCDCYKSIVYETLTMVFCFVYPSSCQLLSSMHIAQLPVS